MFVLDWSFYSLITLGGGLAALVTGLIIWQQREDLSAHRLGLLAFACATWSILTAFEYAAISLKSSLVWAKLSYLGIAVSPALLYLFALYYGRQRLPHPTAKNALTVVSTLTIVAVMTNEWHHLFWTSASVDPITHLVDYVRGPFFYVFMVYAYGLCGMGIAMLIASAITSHSAFIAQRVIVLLGAIIPLVFNGLYLTDYTPIQDMDWTPTSFALSCVVLAIGMRTQRLFDLRPVLRENLLDVMGEAVILIDERGRVADFNKAMVRIAPIMAGAVGVPLATVLPGRQELCDAVVEGCITDEIIEIDVQGEPHVFDARVRQLAYRGGRSRGQLVVLRDITNEHRLKVERDGLLQDLRSAVSRAQELGGLLPICANCKKIRNDQDLWVEVEAFISEHSLAELSSAVCPECQAKLAEENSQES